MNLKLWLWKIYKKLLMEKIRNFSMIQLIIQQEMMKNKYFD